MAEFILVGSTIHVVYLSFYFIDNYQESLENTYAEGLYVVFQTVTIILGLISSVILISNFYLIGFHIYLKCNSLSSYQYIMNKRPKSPIKKILPTYESPSGDKNTSDINLETKVQIPRNDETFSDNEVLKLNTEGYKKSPVE